MRRSLSGDQRWVSVPLLDIKTRIGEPPRLVPRIEWGLNVLVPCPRAAAQEINKLLARDYDNVDVSKDVLRGEQVALLETLDGRGRRTKDACRFSG